jgi:hypothetical protein
MEGRAVNFPSGASYGDVHVEHNRAWEYVAPGIWRSTSVGVDVGWDDVDNKPILFPPSDHKHPIDDVTGLQAALDSEESARIAGDNSLQKALDKEIKDRGDADTLLDLRIDAVEDSITDDGGFVDAPNDGKLYGRQSENWAEVPDAGASDWADINNKPTEFPPAAHNHQIGDVDGLQDALDEAGGGVGGVFISDTEPSDPEDGMMWLDSTTAIVWLWDEDKWLEFPAGGSGDDLPEMTSDATADTLVLRDGNANAKFRQIVCNNMTFNQNNIVTNTADIWFLSGGETSNHGVKKNDAEGMRASLNIYSKDEADALSLTYQIQTDKILRSGDAAIELVASDNSYTNVKFTGENGISVYSDFNGIRINGTGLATENYVAVEIGKEATARSDVDVYLDQKIDNKLDADRIWTGTEAEYNSTSKEANTLYFITA